MMLVCPPLFSLKDVVQVSAQSLQNTQDCDSLFVNDHVALRQVAGVDWTFISVHVHVVREYFL